MTANPRLIERSADLKRELVALAESRRYTRTFERAFAEREDAIGGLDEAQIANFIDYFVLQHQLPAGGTVVERFVADHPELPDDERRMLLGWRDVVEGIFEVKRRDGETVLAENLVDELTYRVRSNAGKRALTQVQPGSFLITRLVPVEDEWLMSGVATLLPKTSRDEAYSMAAQLALQSPSLAFRNPEKLAQARELAAQERAFFIQHFGSDLIVVPGASVPETMNAYMHFRTYEARGEDGKTAAERDRADQGTDPPPLPPQDFGAVTGAPTVAIIYDEIDGMELLADYGAVAETFQQPDLAGERTRRDALLRYLDDASISPRVIERLAAPDPDKASAVFQRVLKRPGFDWQRDGAELLHSRKAEYYAKPPLPSIAPVGEKLAQARHWGGTEQADSGRPARPSFRAWQTRRKRR